MTENHSSVESVVLLRDDTFEELRIIMMQTGSKSELIITEQSDGELTWLSFGSLHHLSRVTVAQDHAASVLRKIGTPDDSLGHALATFFSRPDTYLHDLQDVLDAAGIPYEFVASDGNIAARRAPWSRHQELSDTHW